MSDKFERAMTLMHEAFAEQRELGVRDERRRVLSLLTPSAPTQTVTVIVEPKPVVEPPKPVVVALRPPHKETIPESELTDAATLDPPSYREWQVLRVLPLMVKEGEHRIAEVASRAGVPLGSMGAIFDGLQCKGYIIREDGRNEIAFHGAVKPHVRPEVTHANNVQQARLVQEESAQTGTEPFIRPPTREQLMGGR